MALLTLLFGRPRKAIGALTVDAFLREGHSRSRDATSHPSDDNSPFSDATIRNPDVVTVDGILSDTPLLGASVASFQEFFGGLPGRTIFNGTDSGVIVDGTLQVLRPSREKWALLDEIHRAGEPVTLVTGLKVYPDMMLTRLDCDRTKPSRDLPFSASFQEYRTAEVFVELRVASGGAGVRRSAVDDATHNTGAADAGGGTQMAAPASAEELGAANKSATLTIYEQGRAFIDQVIEGIPAP